MPLIEARATVGGASVPPGASLAAEPTLGFAVLTARSAAAFCRWYAASSWCRGAAKAAFSCALAAAAAAAGLSPSLGIVTACTALAPPEPEADDGPSGLFAAGAMLGIRAAIASADAIPVATRTVVRARREPKRDLICVVPSPGRSPTGLVIPGSMVVRGRPCRASHVRGIFGAPGRAHRTNTRTTAMPTLIGQWFHYGGS